MAIETNPRNIIIISSLLLFAAVSGYLIFSYFSQNTGMSIDQLSEVEIENEGSNEDEERSPDFLGVSQSEPDSSGITQTRPSALGISEVNKGGEQNSSGITQTKP